MGPVFFEVIESVSYDVPALLAEVITLGRIHKKASCRPR